MKYFISKFKERQLLLLMYKKKNSKSMSFTFSEVVRRCYPPNTFWDLFNSSIYYTVTPKHRDYVSCQIQTFQTSNFKFQTSGSLLGFLKGRVTLSQTYGTYQIGMQTSTPFFTKSDIFFGSVSNERGGRDEPIGRERKEDGKPCVT